MENKFWNRAGLYIMVGLIAVAISLPVAVEKAMSFNRTVTVKGLCEREVKADRVIWPVVYKEGGNDLRALYSSITAKNEIIIEWLRAAGIADSTITIAAPKIEDTRTASYGENRAYNYIITSIITVCTDKVQEVIALQAKQFSLMDKGIAIGAGNSWDYPTTYSYTGLNEIKPAMIEEATVNAREAAQKFAKDSKSRIGKIREATQGQFSVEDRDSNTPNIKCVRVVTNITYTLKD